MFNRNKHDRWDISLKSDGLDSRLQGLGNKILASEGLMDAVVEGVPYGNRIAAGASVHIRRIGRAALAYAAGIVLLLSSVWVLSQFWSENEPIVTDPPVVSTTENTTTTRQDTDPTPEIRPDSEGLEFKQSSKEGYMWSGLGSCTDQHLVIPSTYKDLPVERIYLKESEQLKEIRSITIPAGVTMIAGLNGCTNLEEIIVEEGNPIYHSQGNCLIETKPGLLVQGCANSVIPADGSVKTIGRKAFDHCEGLVEITIPEGVIAIEDWAFDGCISLTSVKFPQSLQSIGMYAFNGNHSLKELKLPDNLVTIGHTAFAYCTSLAKVTLPANLPKISESIFIGCNFTEITIPANVTEIGIGAFWDCKNLEKVYFEVTDGWVVKDYDYYKDGKSVDVTTPTQAADYLTDTYYLYTWVRN